MERFIPVEIFRKKVKPFEVLAFFLFHRNDRNFLYHLFGLPVPGFKSRESENLPVFCKWHNSISFLFSLPKKYQYHLTEILNRNFRTNGKRSLFPISPGCYSRPKRNPRHWLYKKLRGKQGALWSM